MANIPNAGVPIAGGQPPTPHWYSFFAEMKRRLEAAVSAAGVTSIFTRTGDVVAETGDYSASQITNDSAVSGANVDDALETLAADIPTTEELQDLVGAMVSGGTESGISVTYDDTNARLNFVVTTASTSAAGIAELATDAEAQAGTSASLVVTPAGLRAATREKLLADRTYYVRTNGSDSNDGLANTAGGAFLTIQKGVDITSGLDFNGHTVLIQVADGAYTAGALIQRMVGMGAGNLIIQGNTTTPANCTITVAGGNCFHLQGGGKVLIYGFTLSTTTSGWCLYSEAFSNMFFNYMRFGVAGVGHMAAVDGGKIQALGNYTITGNATYHWYSEALSIIRAAGITITLSGTRAFTVFANCSTGAIIYCFSNTFSGSATGQRYSATLNGIIHTLGGGATYLPGNAGGGVATQGQYV
jgi:hypothetical protein